jgi:hypothetical protein
MVGTPARALFGLRRRTPTWPVGTSGVWGKERCVFRSNKRMDLRSKAEGHSRSRLLDSSPLCAFTSPTPVLLHIDDVVTEGKGLGQARFLTSFSTRADARRTCLGFVRMVG